MGKLTSALSSIVAIGIVAFLIYYCCLRRKKRNSGVVIQTATLPTTVPQSMPPYNPSAYPTYPGAQPQPPVGMPMPQPIYPTSDPNQQIGGGGYPYPPTSTIGFGAYPNPVVPPVQGPYDNSSPNIQTTAPYPTAPIQFNDLPPPYSDLTKRS